MSVTCGQISQRRLLDSLAFRIKALLPVSWEISSGEKGVSGDCHCIQHPGCMYSPQLLFSVDYISTYRFESDSLILGFLNILFVGVLKQIHQRQLHK